LSGETIILFAAGRLKDALGEVVREFEAASGFGVMTEFGPSGILRERIFNGAAAHVFASADMRNAQVLAGSGLSGAVTPFAANTLCVMAHPKIDIERRDVLHLLLDPKIRLGISTPGSDPAGDYARLVFKRAGALRPGAFEALRNKALTLTGGMASEKPPAGRNLYAWLIDTGRADLFITYRTNAVAARREIPEIKMRELPASLSVGADYGLTVFKRSPGASGALAKRILEPAGRKVLERYGFGLP
jgi:molybdate transport system substrate-binding protein